MHWRLAFEHDYIGAPDLKDKDVTLTISKAGPEQVRVIPDKERDKERDKKEQKLVLHFRELEGRKQGEPRMMCLNKTNAKTIAKLYGNDVEQWVGKRITLYATTCLAFGERVECVRIREQAPKRSA